MSGKQKFTPELKNRIQQDLLGWYRSAQRQLPWRETKDPYLILVSEFMLQQTQVRTVIPYFHRFIGQFPNLESLARAPLESVLKQWEGLGYYRRARHLHALAQEVVQNWNSAFPESEVELKKLPGIGAYTASAVASIAFNRPVGVVDGNVMRVFSRLFNLDWDISRAQSKKSFQSLANELISEPWPGDFNQAVMELGATVCSPQKPNCAECPLNGICEVLKAGVSPEGRPVKTKKTKVRKETYVWAWVEKQGQLLIQQRKQGKMLEDLWELPEIFHETMQLKREDAVCTFDYQYSHIHAVYQVYEFGELASMPPFSKWVSREGMGILPLTGAMVKVLKLRGWD